MCSELNRSCDETDTASEEIDPGVEHGLGQNALLIASDFVDHEAGPGTSLGPGAFNSRVAAFRAALGDARGIADWQISVSKAYVVVGAVFADALAPVLTELAGR